MKKAIAVIGTVIYLASPIDLIPDVFPIIGWLDDIGVLALLANYLAQKPPEAQARELEGDGRSD